jgi:hypothetical protein
MLFIPYDSAEIRTPLTPEQIQEKLKPFIGHRTFAEYFKEPRYQFGGAIKADHFKIFRHVRGRNSYLPIIRGEIQPLPDGTMVTLSFQIHWFVVLFFTSIGGMSFWWHDPTPLIMFVVLHVGLYFIGYLPEKRWAEGWLRRKLSAN